MSHVPASVSVTVISMSNTPFDKYVTVVECADVLFGGYTYSSSVYPAGSRDGFFSSKTSSLLRYAFFIFASPRYRADTPVSPNFSIAYSLIRYRVVGLFDARASYSACVMAWMSFAAEDATAPTISAV